METKNTWRQKLFVVLFVVMLVLVYPLYALLYPHIDTENRENRTLASFPSLQEDGVEAWPGKFEEYLGDHAAFRNQFMRLHAMVDWKLLHTVDSSDVLMGEENWLFMKNWSDSAALDDYQGINAFSEEEMAVIAQNLLALRDALAQNGTEFVLFIAPNKEGVYSQYMPSNIPVVGTSRAQALVAYLQQNTDLLVVYPQAELIDAAATQQVYYKYDSHWNAAGAVIGTNRLQAVLEKPALQCTVEASDEEAVHDLANMASLYALLPPDANCTARYTGEAAVQMVQNTTNDAAYTCDAASGTSLLMLHDSFGAYMRPLLNTEYAESRFVHINGFTETTFAEQDETVFVWELVERNFPRLQDYLPRLVEWAQNA